jgi:hypothetical protein
MEDERRFGQRDFSYPRLPSAGWLVPTVEWTTLAAGLRTGVLTRAMPPIGIRLPHRYRQCFSISRPLRIFPASRQPGSLEILARVVHQDRSAHLTQPWIQAILAEAESAKVIEPGS